MNENDDDFKRPTFTTAKFNMLSLKCYDDQTCAKIAQSGASSDAVMGDYSNVGWSLGNMNSCGILSVNRVQSI